MNQIELHKKLRSLQDLKYRDMQIKIIPTLNPKTIIGVRTPALKILAKEMLKTENHKSFLKKLPHKYFEENQLHAFIISEIKDIDECLKEVEKFLPYVDNWATSDQMSPKIFKRHKEKLLIYIKKWIKSKKSYTVRFGIGMLMQHFLDDAYCEQYSKMVVKLRSSEYYINMMIAWYFATALAKQYKSTISFIEKKQLDTWTHNKAIQKSIESNRITQNQKKYLRSLKISK